MFGLFKAKPPLGPKEKAWTEHRMSWLAEKFGVNRLLETPTLLSDYRGIPEVANLQDAEELLQFLRTWMKIDAANVRLQVFSNVVEPESIGNYSGDANEQTVVAIKQEDFEHRDTLIAAMAVGLARQAIAERELQNELVTDGGWTVELLPVFLGLGVFPANSTVKDSYFDDGSWSSWSVSRRGKLPSRIFGYALALRTLVRGEESTEWSSSLRPDAQVTFEEGMKYLDKTNDTIFTRECEKNPRHAMSREALLDDLKSGSASRKVLTMWELADRAAAKGDYSQNDNISELLMDCMRHKEAEVREAAAIALPFFGRSQHIAQDLADALSDNNAEVRSAAASALGAFEGVDNETLVHDLSGALKDDAPAVVHSAARSLSQFGKAAEPATKMLLKRLRRALIDCSDDEAILFTWAIRNINEDPKTRIVEFFNEADSEYLEHAEGIYEQLEEDQVNQ